MDKFNNRVAMKKIRSISSKRKLARVTIIPVVSTINNILIKNLKFSFQKVVLISSE